MLRDDELKKYYRNGVAHALPAIPRDSSSVSDHYQNVTRMYESSLAYRLSLPSFHVGYEYATTKLLTLGNEHGFSTKESLLELCCGCGTTLVRLATTYDFDITGIDLVNSHIEECQRRIRRYGIQNRVQLLCMNVMDLNEDLKRQDVILSEDSFSHVHDREQLLQTCYKRLNSAGLLVFSDLIRTGAISDSEVARQCSSWCLHEIESFESYVSLLKMVGFKVMCAERNIAKELVEFHIQRDMSRGDLHPRRYLSLFQHHQLDLINKWGRAVFDLRKERLLFYKYIWEGKLDYAFIVALKP